MKQNRLALVLWIGLAIGLIGLILIMIDRLTA